MFGWPPLKEGERGIGSEIQGKKSLRRSLMTHDMGNGPCREADWRKKTRAKGKEHLIGKK